MDFSSDQYFKLVITGSVNSGKTSFIRTISEIDPITTDEYATEVDVAAVKTYTTVAMDYGRRTIDDGIVLNLYGTPGQERFYFMWDILVEGAFGAIFLADSTDEHSLENTKRIIAHFLEKYDLPYLICVTKLDCMNTLGYMETLRRINRPELFALPCNATLKDDVKNALITLLTITIDRYSATEE
jgi:uncharacterized protein